MVRGNFAMVAAVASLLVVGALSPVARASPFCYDTGPGYQKCISSPSGDYFNPIYAGPKVYGGSGPGYDSGYPDSTWTPANTSGPTNPIASAVADAVVLGLLGQQVQANMQGFFDNPANDKTQYNLHVGRVALQKAGDTTYEGVVAVSTGDGPPQDFPVHVTADGQNVAWRLDPGALLPLFQ